MSKQDNRPPEDDDGYPTAAYAVIVTIILIFCLGFIAGRLVPG